MATTEAFAAIEQPHVLIAAVVDEAISAAFGASNASPSVAPDSNLEVRARKSASVCSC